jgi:rod shape-determining protein MreC
MSEALLRRTLFGFLLVLGLVISSVTRQAAPSLPGEFAATIAPVFGLTYRLGQNARAAITALLDRRNIWAENDGLKVRAGELEQENARLRTEVRRLSAALSVEAAQAPQILKVASVIDEDPSGLYRRLVLGQGSNAGLRVGMPITSKGGLVGTITEITERTALVRTILDPESVVGVKVLGQPGRGRAYGQPPSGLRVEISPDAKVKVGDKMISGSIQGLYPADILVGTVTKVLASKPGDLKQVVLVKPSANFSLLEDVFVLKPL